MIKSFRYFLCLKSGKLYAFGSGDNFTKLNYWEELNKSQYDKYVKVARFYGMKYK